MTVDEFSREFDIYYNSISSNDAPGIDLYEKSVYLTKAQLEIVNNYFNPEGNKYKKGFEASSKRREDLRELIRPYISATESTVLTTDDGISPNSQFFRVPNDVYIIIQEKARIDANLICQDDEQKYIKVIPKTHDEFNVQENNPFKNPDRGIIWRLDMYSITSNDILPDSQDLTSSPNKVVELISPYNINQFKFRYIKYPSPIILVNLLTEYPYEQLSVDSITAEQTCALGGASLHREILNRAVEMATSDYTPSELSQRVQMNQRNE
tara:strand:+ start:16361 stop:17161 length:801 start_codon:yes stop_codon:yes gene_type:complete